MLAKYHIDELKLIRINEELKLKIRGWVVSDTPCKVNIYVDTTPIIVSLNQKRDDVKEVFELTTSHNLGFEYTLDIFEFTTLSIELQNDSKIEQIYNGSFENITLEESRCEENPINFNIENIEIFKEEGICIRIKGWAFNTNSEKVVEAKIIDDQGKILYFEPTSIKREDVQKAFPMLKVPDNNGYEILLNIPKEVQYLNLELLSNNYKTKVKQIEIPEYIKVDKAYIESHILMLKRKYKKELFKEILKDIKSISKIKKLKEMYKQQLIEEEKRLNGLLDLKVEEVTPYEMWVENNKISAEMIEGMKSELKGFSYTPKISILMPVWNVEQKWLDKAIKSIMDQTYENWELCIADDCSTKEYIKPYLNDLCQKDKRIKVVYRNKNGNISEATNSAFEIATGEYILLMDNDDELEVNALYEIIKVLQYNQADIIYSDDDKIDEQGNRYAPQFKPDWSPELLLSFMYFSHLFCMKASLYKQVNGCRVGYEGCQDYDLALRVTELTENIVHIPKVLYHWRSLEGSTALDGNAKPEAFERGIKAVQEAFERRKIDGKVKRPEFAISNNLGIFTAEFPNEGPKVSIIIPTKNHVELIERCITSIEKKTTYSNYEIIVINNESDEPDTINYLDKIRHIHKVLDVKNRDGKFSYAYINNVAVEHATGDLILFLNNDTEIIEPNWLSAMVGYSKIENVGVVGARLIFPDNRVQHAGVVMGLYNGMVAPAFKLLPEYSLGYFNYAKVTRNYSCVTAACMLMSKNLFYEVGKFDEENFAVAYNDVDLCMKCIKAGKRVVYAPQAELYHYEGASRGYIDNIDEVLAFKEKYGEYQDPYYNTNLSLRDEQFNICPDSTLNYSKFISNKRIAFGTHNLNFEGAPLHIYEIIKGLIERQYEHKIVVISPCDGPLKEMYEEIGVEVIIVDFNIHLSLNRDAYSQGVDKVTEILRSNSIDLVYANTLEMFYLVGVAKQLALPAIWNIHESVNYKEYYKTADPYVQSEYMNAFMYAKKVIFVCQATLEMYQEMNKANNFDYIYNGINSHEIEDYKKEVTKEKAKELIGAKKDTKVITIIGTVCERKGQFDVVKAMTQLAQEKIELFIVGCRESAYLSKIKEYIEEHRLENIHLINETKEVNVYYRASDICVCASYNESFPRVTLEAMCFELPIVTTPVFGLKEQVINNVNGYYYEPGNIEEMVNSIKGILLDEKVYGEMSKNSSKVLKLLNSHDEMIEKYKKVISQNLLIERR